jgi:hypothetical protein
MNVDFSKIPREVGGSMFIPKNTICKDFNKKNNPNFSFYLYNVRFSSAKIMGLYHKLNLPFIETEREQIG